MRLVLVSMLPMLAAAPRAEACPRGAVCVASGTHGAEIAVAVAPVPEVPRRKTMLDLAIRTDLASINMLATSLRTHVVPRAGELEMPWVWQMLRRNVYSRLPRYERADLPKDQGFSFVLSPVVLAGQQDTVPGVGVEGGF